MYLLYTAILPAVFPWPHEKNLIFSEALDDTPKVGFSLSRVLFSVSGRICPRHFLASWSDQYHCAIKLKLVGWVGHGCLY